MTKDAGVAPNSPRSAGYRIDPFDLHLFIAVLDSGTITGGAQAASLSLSAASTRLKALEIAVGAPLLLRSKTGVVATPAGRALGRHAQRVLADMVSLHAEMGQFGRGLRGTVRLLCNTAALARNLSPPLGRFLQRHADIDIDLQELPSDAIVEALRSEAADIGIVADHVDTTHLHATPWMDDELVAVLPRRHLPARRRSIGFAELLDAPLVGLSVDSGLSQFLLQQARRIGRAPHHRVRMNSFDAVVAMVAAGAGVAVMPASAAQRHAHTGTRIVLLVDAWARRRLLICTAPRARDTSAVMELTRMLASVRA